LQGQGVIGDWMPTKTQHFLNYKYATLLFLMGHFWIRVDNRTSIVVAHAF
jgi:hypothetical protein